MENINNIKRVVVKVGTSSLTYKNGRLNLRKMEKLVRQLVDISNAGIEVVLVTSGAVGAGIGVLGLKEKPKTLPEKQACAAVGQLSLLHMYQKMFSEYGKHTGQVLLTRDDISDRKRYLNARNTFFSLLDLGVIPIVNENDAIAVEELKLKFGDNDTLSAMVASLVEADLLAILSDIDGLYDSNPNQNPEAKLIPSVHKITKEIEAMAGGAGSSFGTGGMATKIKAAKIATAAGVSMVILNGASEDIINRFLEGETVGTLFHGTESPLQSKKHWIAYEAVPHGVLYVDNGAENALKNNKSLLPKGITKVSGVFNDGDPIEILNEDGQSLAKGLTSYNSFEIKQIMGLETSEIEGVLGHKDYDVVVHKNNMVLI
ncbi:glutamate 5-kinase [Clostridium cellulovorans]|uniref:Glutamate 5-kinase n=1 Tax=Clostridium cellulovorans (strain ATCC 35296 / DSM 3052 / OCM 3 / 743B) TaxID=573061 RepID=D9SWS2_CLOC7|nr:glutamate 5-kinase [Clostridium cellulovorans]ADL51283.1 glutamate 5-kinase [Clostridium cellulovorans 743B]